MSTKRDNRTAFKYKGISIQPYAAGGPYGFLMDYPHTIGFRKRYWVIEDGSLQGLRVATKAMAMECIDKHLDS